MHPARKNKSNEAKVHARKCLSYEVVLDTSVGDCKTSTLLTLTLVVPSPPCSPSDGQARKALAPPLVPFTCTSSASIMFVGCMRERNLLEWPSRRDMPVPVKILVVLLGDLASSPCIRCVFKRMGTCHVMIGHLIFLANLVGLPIILHTFPSLHRTSRL